MSENPFSGRLSLGYFLNKEWCFTDFCHSSEPPAPKLLFASLLIVSLLFPLLAFADDAPNRGCFVFSYYSIPNRALPLLAKRAFLAYSEG